MVKIGMHRNCTCVVIAYTTIERALPLLKYIQMTIIAWLLVGEGEGGSREAGEEMAEEEMAGIVNNDVLEEFDLGYCGPLSHDAATIGFVPPPPPIALS
jgi:hypothetical protein